MVVMAQNHCFSCGKETKRHHNLQDQWKGIVAFVWYIVKMMSLYFVYDSTLCMAMILLKKSWYIFFMKLSVCNQCTVYNMFLCYTVIKRLRKGSCDMMSLPTFLTKMRPALSKRYRLINCLLTNILKTFFFFRNICEIVNAITSP